MHRPVVARHFLALGTAYGSHGAMASKRQMWYDTGQCEIHGLCGIAFYAPAD